MKNFLKLIGLIFVCFLPGIIGGFFTANNLSPWYGLLVKPSFNPPSWIFSPVWTTLYTLMGISLFLILKAENSRDKTQGVVFFCVQLVLNGLWSIVFFGLHQILLAFILIIFLLLFIILSILKFYSVSKPAAYILIPYLLWVSFASVLNLSLYQLNS
jgi:benzodiazapine receptor